MYVVHDCASFGHFDTYIDSKGRDGLSEGLMVVSQTHVANYVVGFVFGKGVAQNP